MLGLRKDVDTSRWSEYDWRFAKKWNIAFLVGWITFFSLAVRACILPVNWFMLVPTLLIAIIGFVIQIKSLLRISIWLDNQKNSKFKP